MATIEDKSVILRLYSNYILSEIRITSNVAYDHVRSGLQMSQKYVSKIVTDSSGGDVCQLAILRRPNRGTVSEQNAFEYVIIN